MMIRALRLTVGLLFIILMTGRDACAQWGYGGWGWGGWGVGTPAGDALQGAGQFAMGAGAYNLSTAQARSINADTAMRWNEYVYQSNLEATRRYTERKNADIAKNKSLYDSHQRRLRENPEAREVENGDALNAAVTDLDDPRLSSSAVRAANAPVPASAIAEVPFLYASERITIMMDRIRESVKWPDVFDQRFAGARKQFDALRARLREESQNGDVSAQGVQDARRFLSDLRAKIEAEPLKNAAEQNEAMTFINSCESLLDLLQKPDIGPAIIELRKVTDTTIGNLLGFMHTFNLRFGPATTPKQREIYRQLYEILDRTRDTVLAEAKLGSPYSAGANPKHATDFLQGVKQGRSQVR
jgi:hypothetical protein